MIGLITDMVEICAYDPEWAQEFLKEKAFLEEILKGYKVLIEHVGSTSLVNCPAKPIIDVAIGIESFEYGNQLVPILCNHSYIYKGDDGIPGRHYFKKQRDNVTTHHIHMSKIGSTVWNNQILFRDYMREYPDKLAEYIKLKQYLASLYPEDRALYSKGKNEFITSIIEDAKVLKKIKGEVIL